MTEYDFTADELRAELDRRREIEELKAELARRDRESRTATSMQNSTEMEYDPYLGSVAKGSRKAAKSAAATGMLQGASFGFADELLAGAGALKDVLTGNRTLSDAYAERIERARSAVDVAKQENPAQYYTGDVLGGLAAPAGIGKQLVKGGGLVSKGLKSALGSAAVGGLEAAGRSSEKSLGEILTGAALGGAIGAVSPAIGALATKALTKTQKAAKLGATAKQLQTRLGKEADSKILRNIDDLERLGVVQEADYARLSKAGNQTQQLETIADRAVKVREGSYTKLNEILTDYKSSNPNKLFTADDLGLTKLRAKIDNLRTTAQSLDPSTSRASAALDDLEDLIDSNKLTIDTLIDIKSEVDSLAEDMFFKKQLGKRRGDLINEVRSNLRETLNNNLGDEYRNINKDLSAIHSLESVISPALAKSQRTEGLSAGQGPIGRLGSSLSKIDIGRLPGRLVGAAADVAQSGVDTLSSIREYLPSSPSVSAVATSQVFSERPKLDPKNAEDRVIIRDRIRSKLNKKEINSVEAARRLDLLNGNNEADESDLILEPEKKDLPDLTNLDRVVLRKGP